MNVCAGAASAVYVLPGGTPGGTYIIEALQRHQPTSPATPTTARPDGYRRRQATAAASASATFSTSAQNVPLNATVTSAAGTVNEGTETFTILNGTTVDRHARHRQCLRGRRQRQLRVACRDASRTYIIQAVYNGTPNFGGDTDTSHVLTIAPATVSAVSVEWGSESAPL